MSNVLGPLVEALASTGLLMPPAGETALPFPSAMTVREVLTVLRCAMSKIVIAALHTTGLLSKSVPVALHFRSILLDVSSWIKDHPTITGPKAKVTRMFRAVLRRWTEGFPEFKARLSRPQLLPPLLPALPPPPPDITVSEALSLTPASPEDHAAMVLRLQLVSDAAVALQLAAELEVGCLAVATAATDTSTARS